MTRDEGHRVASQDERPPRLNLIRVFLSLRAGFMAGLVGWTTVTMATLLAQGLGAAQLPPLPPALQAVAFFGPAAVAGCWLFVALGSSR